jgi:hypothetical protein
MLLSDAGRYLKLKAGEVDRAGTDERSHADPFAVVRLAVGRGRPPPRSLIVPLAARILQRAKDAGVVRAAGELPGPALDPEQIDAVMASYGTPRRRAWGLGPASSGRREPASRELAVAHT